MLLTAAAVSVEQDGVSGFVAVELPSLPTVVVIECSTRSVDVDGGSGLVCSRAAECADGGRCRSVDTETAAVASFAVELPRLPTVVAMDPLTEMVTVALMQSS